ncbi:hypothetical protein HispidOSU_007993 [Sigmodon hispidus]
MPEVKRLSRADSGLIREVYSVSAFLKSCQGCLQTTIFAGECFVTLDLHGCLTTEQILLDGFGRRTATVVK